MRSASIPDSHPNRGSDHDILLEALDQLDAAIAIYGPSAELRFCSRNMRHLLEASDRRSVLHSALEALLSRMAAFAAARAASDGSPSRYREERFVREESSTFRLFAVQLAEADDRAGTSFLVAVERTASGLLLEQRLREKFRLTSTQYRVALLLAEGRSNGKIAVALGISEHTARNHTKAVLAKLGLTSRAQVAAALRRLGEE